MHHDSYLVDALSLLEGIDAALNDAASLDVEKLLGSVGSHARARAPASMIAMFFK